MNQIDVKALAREFLPEGEQSIRCSSLHEKFDEKNLCTEEGTTFKVRDQSHLSRSQEFVRNSGFLTTFSILLLLGALFLSSKMCGSYLPGATVAIVPIGCSALFTLSLGNCISKVQSLSKELDQNGVEKEVEKAVEEMEKYFGKMKERNAWYQQELNRINLKFMHLNQHFDLF